jgi:hypothetical protein
MDLREGRTQCLAHFKILIKINFKQINLLNVLILNKIAIYIIIPFATYYLFTGTPCCILLRTSCQGGVSLS